MSVRLLAGKAAEGCHGFHSIAHINGALTGDILRLHAGRKLVGNGKQSMRLLCHGGDQLLGIILPDRRSLPAARLRNIVGPRDLIP